MIQQIYITDYLSDAAAQPVEMIQSLVAQCPALLNAQWTLGPLPPLKAFFNVLMAHDHTRPDLSVSALLSARQTWPAARPTFCLLPVHLGMRRDTFSLQAVIPLVTEVYVALTARLQTHFADDFVIEQDSSQRFWWIKPVRDIQAQCQWPQDCLYQQALQWQPQGPDAAVIRQWSNEIQMLLHQFALAADVANWPAELNSLWFASVGDMPAWQPSVPAIAGQGEVFAGLQASQLPAVRPLSMAACIADKQAPQALWVADQWQTFDWPMLSSALQAGSVSALTLVLPFAERSVEVHYKKRLRWQFWQKSASAETLLQQLEATLTAAG
ncbi:hypothetical protein [Methylophilus sp. 5]|uniref:hypothetical protein n=1 Tax=Methylophilus sp. 5 TaxID=1112274 RepID=UPI00048EC85A|nr:hypothetical protein [Methylophilus sp. 5]